MVGGRIRQIIGVVVVVPDREDVRRGIARVVPVMVMPVAGGVLMPVVCGVAVCVTVTAAEMHVRPCGVVVRLARTDPDVRVGRESPRQPERNQ